MSAGATSRVERGRKHEFLRQRDEREIGPPCGADFFRTQCFSFLAALRRHTSEGFLGELAELLVIVHHQKAFEEVDGGLALAGFFEQASCRDAMVRNALVRVDELARTREPACSR